MRLSAAVLAFLIAAAPAPCFAQAIAYDTSFAEDVSQVPGSDEARGGERFVGARNDAHPPGAISGGVAAYGPFRVLDETRAALVDATDSASPARFAAMLRDHPGIALIELIDCPGTEDDAANLRLGRMIRAAGLATYVPAGGSVRSGGVELFLAGARRMAAPQAEFAVHAWIDDTGHQATDYAMSDPDNAKYLAYYRSMGMSEAEAAAFYAMTNAAPFEQARYLSGSDIARWIRLDPA